MGGTYFVPELALQLGIFGLEITCRPDGTVDGTTTGLIYISINIYTHTHIDFSYSDNVI